MAQITSLTLTANSYNVTVMRNEVNTLLSNMLAGKSILVADVRKVVDIYNQLRAHTHEYSDLRGRDEFGNLSVYSTTGTRVQRTSDPGPNTAALSYPTNVVLNGQVTAADINLIIAAVNQLRTHTHAVVDQTS